MLVKLFKELIDYKWYLAFVVLFILFLPIKSESLILLKNQGLLSFLGETISFSAKSATTFSVISVFVIILISIFYRVMLSESRIINKGYHIGLLMGVMFYTFWQNELPNFLEILSIILILLSIYYILKLDLDKRPDIMLFNACLLLGSVSIIDFRFVFFYALPFIGLFLQRLFSFRILMLGIVGLILPHLFLFTYNFLLLDDYEYFSNIVALVGRWKLNTTFLSINSFKNIFSISLLSILFFVTLAKLSDKKIFIRKKTILLVWFFFFSLLLLFIQQDSISYISLILSLYFGFFASFSIVKIFKKKIFIFALNLLYFLLVGLNFYYWLI